MASGGNDGDETIQPDESSTLRVITTALCAAAVAAIIEVDRPAPDLATARQDKPTHLS